VEVIGNEMNGGSLEKRPEIGPIAGRRCSCFFKLKDADLYAFSHRTKMKTEVF